MLSSCFGRYLVDVRDLLEFDENGGSGVMEMKRTMTVAHDLIIACTSRNLP
jgi:hypothetical protein